jgi:hypothetical protein
MFWNHCYCIKQLNIGIEHFSRITAGDYSQIKECFHGFPWSLTEDDSHEDGDISDNDSDADGDAVEDNYDHDYTDDFNWHSSRTELRISQW